MYVPIMKNRNEEMKVVRDMSNYFNDSIIPLIELIEDEHKIKYKVDKVTGKEMYELKPGNKKRTKVKLPPLEDDIITLEKIQSRLDEKKAFIDFFKFSTNEYDKKTFKGIELSLKISRNYGYYKKRLLEVGNFVNLIPVISIKKGFNISEHDLIDLVNELKKNNKSIAIRITDNYLDDYTDFLEYYLLQNDYLMLDIRSQPVDSKFLELEEFKDLETDAKKIILNSPRLRKLKNGGYENLVFTQKIDNKLAKLYLDYQFDGFGDFGGLKDDLPADNDGGNGLGAALGLIYSKKENAFFSIVNYDTNKGMRGFEYVRNEILNRSSLLDSENDCIAVKRIKEMNEKFGNWATWNNITLTRYIYQHAKK